MLRLVIDGKAADLQPSSSTARGSSRSLAYRAPLMRLATPCGVIAALILVQTRPTAAAVDAHRFLTPTRPWSSAETCRSMGLSLGM